MTPGAVNGTNGANSHANGAANGYIKFAMNVPQEVALKYVTGKEVAGNYGTDAMFTAVDGRRFYVPPFVGTQIEALGLKPGQAVIITKRESSQGNRKGVEWVVERAGAFPVEEPRGQAARPAPVAAASYEQPNNATPQSSRERQAQEGPVPVGQRRLAREQITVALTDFLFAAFDAYSKMDAYTKGKGAAYEWNGEDVRASANAMLIEWLRKGGSL